MKTISERRRQIGINTVRLQVEMPPAIRTHLEARAYAAGYYDAREGLPSREEQIRRASAKWAYVLGFAKASGKPTPREIVVVASPDVRVRVQWIKRGGAIEVEQLLDRPITTRRTV